MFSFETVKPRLHDTTGCQTVGFNCFGLFYLLLSFLAPAECGRLQQCYLLIVLILLEKSTFLEVNGRG